MMADPKFAVPVAAHGGGIYLLDDHEVVQRGLRHLVESAGLVVAGESGSAREASRRIPALRPVLALLDDDLPDGSGAEVCRAVAAADPAIRCVLVTDTDDESVLIESILAGAWGCLSKLDDSGEQLRLISRVLAGHTAYSRRFYPAVLGPAQEASLRGAEEKLRTLSNRESVVALGLARGLSNRQIGQQMFIAEKTVKNMVSSILDKLGMARRTEVAVMVAGSVNRSLAAAGADYRSCGFPDLVSDVTAALWECVREEPSRPGTAGERTAAAARLAQTLDATKSRPAVPQYVPSGHHTIRHGGRRPMPPTP